MRSVFYSLLSLATIASALAIEPRATPKSKSDAAADDDWAAEDVVPDTVFNGVTVPPMKELGTDVNKEISHGNWYEPQLCLRGCAKLTISGSLNITPHYARTACA